MKNLVIILSLVFFGLTTWAGSGDSEKIDSKTEAVARNIEDCPDTLACNTAAETPMTPLSHTAKRKGKDTKSKH